MPWHRRGGTVRAAMGSQADKGGDAELEQANSCIAHLLAKTERGSEELSRVLHDELGGLLVAAVMDLAWAQEHPVSAEDGNRRVTRAVSALRSAIDIKRRAIEELRPTLLENVGLFAAIRWQVKHALSPLGISWTEHYPDAEPKLTHAGAVAVFRVAQEALGLIAERDQVSIIEIDVAADAARMTLTITGNDHAPLGRAVDMRWMETLDCMRHRLRRFGGKIEVLAGVDGGSKIHAVIPRSRELDIL